MTTRSQPTIDLSAFTAWLDDHGLGVGPVTSVGTLGGGTQNLLLRLTRDGRNFILRAAPAGSGEAGDATMRREARVLAALAKTEVPHPKLIATEPSTDTLGRAFYLMEEVAGTNVVQHPPTHAQAAVLGPSFVDALLHLDAIDLDAVGLADLGHPEGFVERQPSRWRWQLERYRELDGYPGAQLPHVDAIVDWLEANVPPTQRPGLLHGDVHLGNVLMDPDGRVAALVDWELTTVGDPLLDLGQLLVTWPDRSGCSLVGPVASPRVPGFARASELAERYRARTTRNTSNLAWYTVLAGFRLGALLEGTYARAHAGLAPMKLGTELHQAASRLLRDAHGRLSLQI